MPVRRSKKGDDLSKIDHIDISAELAGEGVVSTDEFLEGIAQSGEFTFERAMSDAEDHARKLLEVSNVSEEELCKPRYREALRVDDLETWKYPDPVWFAKSILGEIDQVQYYVSEGEAKKAAFSAFGLGLLVKESEAREVFPSALRTRSTRKAAIAKHAKNQAPKEWFMKAYRELRELLPDLSRQALIEKVYDGSEIPQGPPAWARQADREDSFGRSPGRPKDE